MTVSYILCFSLTLLLEAECPVAFTQAPMSSTKPPTTTTTTTPTTTPTTTTVLSSTVQPCALDYGYTVFAINFLNYSNPSDFKSTGIKCDDGKPVNGRPDLCDLVFEICVSPIDKPR